MTDNPQGWLHLNWVHNHERFYFSGSGVDRYENKEKPSFKMLNSEIKCKSGDRFCYMSGLPIRGNEGKCSHILPLSTIAMLCGIPNQTYKDECAEIIGGTPEFSMRYKSFQEEMWSLVYGWALNTCNRLKGNHPFLKINFKLKELKLIPYVQTSTNIKKLLGSLFYGGIKDFTPPVGVNVDQYVVDRYESMYQTIDNIEHKLKSYDKWELKQYNYVSTKTTLNVIIHKVLNHGPFKWVKPLYVLFLTSMNDVVRDMGSSTNASIHTFLEFVKTTTIDDSDTPSELVYYDETNLPMDVIYGGLLRLKQTSMDSDMFTSIGMINLPNIVHVDMGDKEDIQNIEKFCMFFRYYVNSENTIKHIINPHLRNINKDILNMNFKKEVISITNYIWNLYSSYYNLEEAIINGSSDTLDELTKGPKLDDKAKELNGIITIMKLLESMGNELADKTVAMVSETTRTKSEKKLKRQTKQKKRTHKKPSKAPDILHTMKFMVGNKEISF
jgi:hypothetical protein